MIKKNKPNYKFLTPKNPEKSALNQKSRVSLSIFLLFSGILTISGILGWAFIFSSNDNIEINVESISSTKEKKLEMTGAKYTGQTASGTFFLITAERAIEDEGKMRLFKPDGKLETLQRGDILMNSREALFGLKNNNIELIGNVEIFQSSNSMLIKSQKMKALINDEIILSDFPVELTSPEIHLKSEGMTAHNYGEKIIFNGKTQLKLK